MTRGSKTFSTIDFYVIIRPVSRESEQRLLIIKVKPNKWPVYFIEIYAKYVGNYKLIKVFIKNVTNSDFFGEKPLN